MPRSKQTAIASSANVIKININTKTKKKPRKTRARKPAIIHSAKPPPLPSSTSTVHQLLRPAVDHTNILRDIQLSQTNLSEMTKKNTEEIRRLNSLATSVLPATAPPVPRTPKPVKVATPKTNPRIKEIKKRLETLKAGKKLFDDSDLKDPVGLSKSGAVPVPRNPAFGGAGAENVASYQSVLNSKDRDEEIRTKYEDMIDSFDDIAKLKGWANKNLNTNQNRSQKSLPELQEYLKSDPKFYDVFYARELAQYPTPQKGGADEDATLPSMFGGNDGY